MLTFVLSIVALIVGYFTYGKIIEKIFAPNGTRPTPAYSVDDKIDFIPVSGKKNFFVTLINIAGTGPIFGPIMGALYGPVAFIWIVLGCIFAGAVHDYLIGMISVRNRGAHLPALAQQFLGKKSRYFVNFFTLLLLLLVGTVFVSTPAGLLRELTNNKVPILVFIVAIYIYYVLATMVAFDKIIARVYPYLGFLLFFSAAAILVMLIVKGANIPNLSFENRHPSGAPIFPLLFLTISCGALSGFHATQNPIIARTIKNEKQGRSVFYLAMIGEGIIALIWAAAAMSLTHNTGDLQAVINSVGPGGIVKQVSNTLLGPVVGMVAIIGVVIFPITSGDTAFRSARMVLADFIKLPQKPIKNRLLIAVPLFVISFVLINVNFEVLWRYFSWANQAMATITLYVCASYLFIRGGKGYISALIPAMFMCTMAMIYILNAPIGFRLPLNIAYIGGIVAMIVITIGFFYNAQQKRKAGISTEEHLLPNNVGLG
jgi:carbon starvation protein CstA